MTLHRYDLLRGTGLHTATRNTLAGTLSDGAKGLLKITLTDNPADTETLIFAGLTWTFKTAAGAGREVTIGASAAATATAFVTAFNLHADAATYTATNPSSGVIGIKAVADSGTVALTSASNGTCDHSYVIDGALNTTVAVPVASNGVTLIIDDAVVTTKLALLEALRALARIVRKDMTAETAPSGINTSGTVTD